MLEQRASALKSGKFDRAGRIEEKMTAFKNANIDALMRPVKAIVIFQNENNFQRMVNEAGTIDFKPSSKEHANTSSWPLKF